MILLSACRVRLVVQRDGGLWSLFECTRNHFVHHQHPDLSLEIKLQVENLLILIRSHDDFLLELDDSVSRWMFFSAWSPPKVFTIPSATGNMNSSSLFGNINSFEVSPLASISDASISSSSWKSATSMTPFQIPPAQKVHSLRQFQVVYSFQIDGFVTDPLEVGCCSTDESNGMIGP